MSGAERDGVEDEDGPTELGDTTSRSTTGWRYPGRDGKRVVEAETSPFTEVADEGFGKEM